jgi:hypothetical protein
VAFFTSQLLGGGRVIAFDEAGELVYADCNSSSGVLRVVGISVHAAAPGEEILLRRSGLLTDSAWTWNPALPLYLGVSGVLVQTLPPGALIAHIVAVPVSATTILVTLNPPVLII